MGMHKFPGELSRIFWPPGIPVMPVADYQISKRRCFSDAICFRSYLPFLIIYSFTMNDQGVEANVFIKPEFSGISLEISPQFVMGGIVRC